jgi:hypothetical protein
MKGEWAVPDAALLEVELEWEEEPILTYTRRNTGALCTDSPPGHHSGVASPKVPCDDSLDKNASLDSGNTMIPSPRSEVGVMGAT